MYVVSTIDHTLSNEELAEAIDKTFDMYEKSWGSQKEAIHDHLLKLLKEQAKRAEIDH